MATTPRSIRIGDEEWAELNRHAQAAGLDPSRVVRACVAHWNRVAREDPRGAALVVVEADASLARLAELVGYEPPDR